MNDSSIANVITIICLIVTILGTAFFYFDAIGRENDNVKNAISIDVNLLKNNIAILYENISKHNMPPSSYSKEKFVPIGLIYPNTGTYFAYQSAITKLPYATANDITYFYTNVIFAEEYRKEMNVAMANNDSTNYNLIYPRYRDSITRANNTLRSLDNDLDIFNGCRGGVVWQATIGVAGFEPA